MEVNSCVGCLQLTFVVKSPYEIHFLHTASIFSFNL